jgi:hypothetical protein
MRVRQLLQVMLLLLTLLEVQACLLQKCDSINLTVNCQLTLKPDTASVASARAKPGNNNIVHTYKDKYYAIQI